MKARKKILIAPLSWGLGHASRCIPLIEAFLAQGAEVVLASDGAALDLLRREFPDLAHFELPAYNIRYPFASMSLSILLQMPKILRGGILEYFWLRRFLKKQSIDVVISDNRFGFFNRQVKSIFMTHQVQIQTPYRWTSYLVNAVNHFFIRQFDTCWIPDLEGNNRLAGKLSDMPLRTAQSRASSPTKSPFQYIGILSRMTLYPSAKKYRAAFILSGPEPQRRLLETKIVAEINRLSKQATVPEQTLLPFLLIRGTNQTCALAFETAVEVHNVLTRKDLNQKMLESELIICRSGYSSLMDLVKLQVPAVLIPTPGQTEQEYLALKLSRDRQFFSMTQAQFNLSVALEKVKPYHGFVNFPVNEDRIPQIVHELLKV